MAEVGWFYGLTFASCVPADPQSKGGSEATVRIATGDLVPTDAHQDDEIVIVHVGRDPLGTDRGWTTTP
jgi:hypothetical protein